MGGLVGEWRDGWVAAFAHGTMGPGEAEGRRADAESGREGKREGGGGWVARGGGGRGAGQSWARSGTEQGAEQSRVRHVHPTTAAINSSVSAGRDPFWQALARETSQAEIRRLSFFSARFFMCRVTLARPGAPYSQLAGRRV